MANAITYESVPLIGDFLFHYGMPALVAAININCVAVSETRPDMKVNIMSQNMGEAEAKIMSRIIADRKTTPGLEPAIEACSYLTARNEFKHGFSVRLKSMPFDIIASKLLTPPTLMCATYESVKNLFSLPEPEDYLQTLARIQAKYSRNDTLKIIPSFKGGYSIVQYTDKLSWTCNNIGALDALLGVPTVRDSQAQYGVRIPDDARLRINSLVESAGKQIDAGDSSKIIDLIRHEYEIFNRLNFYSQKTRDTLLQLIDSGARAVKMLPEGNVIAFPLPEKRDDVAQVFSIRGFNPIDVKVGVNQAE